MNYSLLLKGFALTFSMYLLACQVETKTEAEAPLLIDDNPAKNIIAQSIAYHGGASFEKFELDFDFRNIHYKGSRLNGKYQYSRNFNDSMGPIEDVLSNEGFERRISGNKADIPEGRSKAFANSVNSVWYFALLPFGLNSDAVIATLEDEQEINGQNYYRIRVSFSEAGGGEDFEDVFLYWFDTETYALDFLAYEYHTEGGGLRFREVFDRAEAGPLKINQYRNYKPYNADAKLDDLMEAFLNGELELLSKIELENIQFKSK